MSISYDYRLKKIGKKKKARNTKAFKNIFFVRDLKSLLKIYNFFNLTKPQTIEISGLAVLSNNFKSISYDYKKYNLLRFVGGKSNEMSIVCVE